MFVFVFGFGFGFVATLLPPVDEPFEDRLSLAGGRSLCGHEIAAKPVRQSV